jgi:ABC-2 type transport system ATP-binding protein
VFFTVQNFLKSYNNHPVLNIHTLDISSGVHWFEGENGSGKSTFFRTIAGIIPFDGEMELCGTKNNKENAVNYRRLVNYAYAEPKYPDYLSGADIIKFVNEARGSNERQVNELIERFRINDFYKNTIHTYSSGMLKKISLITAFLGNPKLILLDEPFTTIDSQTADLVYELINEYRINDISFFIASHQPLDSTKVKTDNRFRVAEGKITLAE